MLDSKARLNGCQICQARTKPELVCYYFIKLKNCGLDPSLVYLFVCLFVLDPSRVSFEIFWVAHTRRDSRWGPELQQKVRPRNQKKFFGSFCPEHQRDLLCFFLPLWNFETWFASASASLMTLSVAVTFFVTSLGGDANLRQLPRQAWVGFTDVLLKFCSWKPIKSNFRESTSFGL